MVHKKNTHPPSSMGDATWDRFSAVSSATSSHVVSAAPRGSPSTATQNIDATSAELEALNDQTRMRSLLSREFAAMFADAQTKRPGLLYQGNVHMVIPYAMYTRNKPLQKHYNTRAAMEAAINADYPGVGGDDLTLIRFEMEFRCSNWSHNEVLTSDKQYRVLGWMTWNSDELLLQWEFAPVAYPFSVVALHEQGYSIGYKASATAPMEWPVSMPYTNVPTIAGIRDHYVVQETHETLEVVKTRKLSGAVTGDRFGEYHAVTPTGDFFPLVETVFADWFRCVETTIDFDTCNNPAVETLILDILDDNEVIYEVDKASRTIELFAGSGEEVTLRLLNTRGLYSAVATGAEIKNAMALLCPDGYNKSHNLGDDHRYEVCMGGIISLCEGFSGTQEDVIQIYELEDDEVVLVDKDVRLAENYVIIDTEGISVKDGAQSSHIYTDVAVGEFQAIDHDSVGLTIRHWCIDPGPEGQQALRNVKLKPTQVTKMTRPGTEESIVDHVGNVPCSEVVDCLEAMMRGKTVVAKGPLDENRLLNNRFINGNYGVFTGWNKDKSWSNRVLDLHHGPWFVGGYETIRTRYARPHLPPAGWEHNPIDEILVFSEALIQGTLGKTISSLEVIQDDKLKYRWWKKSGRWLTINDEPPST